MSGTTQNTNFLTAYNEVSTPIITTSNIQLKPKGY